MIMQVMQKGLQLRYYVPLIKDYSFHTEKTKTFIYANMAELDRTVWGCAAIFIGTNFSSNSFTAR